VALHLYGDSGAHTRQNRTLLRYPIASERAQCARRHVCNAKNECRCGRASACSFSTMHTVTLVTHPCVAQCERGGPKHSLLSTMHTVTLVTHPCVAQCERGGPKHSLLSTMHTVTPITHPCVAQCERGGPKHSLLSTMHTVTLVTHLCVAQCERSRGSKHVANFFCVRLGRLALSRTFLLLFTGGETPHYAHASLTFPL
jgi:hypothetical protein